MEIQVVGSVGIKRLGDFWAEDNDIKSSHQCYDFSF